ncbi:MAG TPA: hypothetical protein VHK27_14545, partial [Gammaproteobacteria bacterium]|nr:hypothetical protein [Gammaproteobacteria bacterium]
IKQTVRSMRQSGRGAIGLFMRIRCPALIESSVPRVLTSLAYTGLLKAQIRISSNCSGVWRAFCVISD